MNPVVWRRFGWLLGVLLLGTAMWAPLDLLEPPPAADGSLPTPPVRGVTVLRAVLGVDGVLLILASVFGLSWIRGPRSPTLWTPPTRLGRPLRGGWLWLIPITLLALLLRMVGLGSDLWLDEISTVLDCRTVPPLELITTFHAAGRHLLNSLSVTAMMAVFGSAEWAIRTPAMLLGVAGIPAIYYLARVGFESREAMLTAVLLATSYHHVFFSQNARGYTGFLCWGMLGTALFLRALEHRRPVIWALYVVTSFLGAATLLLSFFIVAGHGVTLVAIGWHKRHRWRALWPAAREALVAWGVLVWGVFHLYAVVSPQVAVYVGHTYRSKALGFAPFSWRHLEVWLRGAAEGFGGGTLVVGVVVVAVGGLGALWFLRRQWVFGFALVAPVLILGTYKLAAGLRFSPRFFLWALPVIYLILVGSASLVAEALSRLGVGKARWATKIPGLLVTFLIVSSMPALMRSYRVPKQPTRQSLEWIAERRQPGELVAGAYLGKWGLRYYGPSLGWREGTDFFAVHQPDELAAVELAASEKDVWLLTTFPRALAIEYPELSADIRRRYYRVQHFEATVGDAEVALWRRRDRRSEMKPQQ